jgi:hypothetical protein
MLARGRDQMTCLVLMLGTSLGAATGIYHPQVAHHHHCAAQPGTVAALYCPASAPTPHHHHRYAKK